MATPKEISILRDLPLLEKVIEAGSYSKAAEKQRIQQPNISSKIHNLEKELQVKLFSRSSKGVSPTHECLDIINYSKRIDAIIHEMRNYSESSKRVNGEIVLWTTDGICYCLMPYVAKFQKDYPEIKIKLVCTNEMPSFINREADIAISYISPRKFEPIKDKEYKIKFGLFASQKYFDDYGKPKDLEDLIMNHRICDRKEYNNTWNEWRDIVNRAKYVTNNCNTTAMLIKATKDGLGVGLHPVKYAKFEPEMKLIDIDLNMEHSCWVIYHKDDENTPKIKLFAKEIDKCMKILSEE